jgi:hypothetical protein
MKINGVNHRGVSIRQGEMNGLALPHAQDRAGNRAIKGKGVIGDAWRNAY